MTAPLVILKPHSRDLGGFTVRRILPAQAARTVGPFIFFDHLGPTELAPGGMDVRPHPHIGLATVTFLFEGALMHRDSLGTVQKIVPGDMNWMTAGRGITHSERTPDEDRQGGMTMHGLQSWAGLPASGIVDDNTWFAWLTPGSAQQLTVEGACGLLRAL